MTDKADEPRPRRRRILKILLGLILLMGIVVALLPTCASTGVGRSWVEGRIEGALHRDATLEDFDASWSSGLRFGGLTLANPEGFGEEPLVTIEDLVVRPGLFDLMGGDLDVAIELRNATLRVEIDEDGRSNLDGMLEEKKPDEDESDKEPAPLTLIVRIVNFTYIAVDRREGGSETRVEEANLELTLRGESRADLSGSLSATIARIATSNGLTSSDISVKAEGENGKWKLEDVRVPVNEGTVVARGTADLGEGGEYELISEVRGVRLERGFPLLSHALPVFAIDSEGEASGTLSAQFTLNGPTRSANPAMALRGTGDISITKGKIQGNAIIGQAMALLDEGKALEFDDLGTTFRIEEGKVHSKFKLGDGSLKLRLKGFVGIDGTVDYMLQLKPKGDQWKQVRKFLGEDGLLPVKITGSLGDLQVEQPDPSKMLSGALERGIGELIGR